jgi:hypothetical protein
MVPVAPDRSAAAASVVDGAGEPNGQAAGAARQRLLVLGLDDEMYVVVLGRELDHAEPGSTGLADGLLDGGKRPLGA